MDNLLSLGFFKWLYRAPTKSPKQTWHICHIHLVIRNESHEVHKLWKWHHPFNHSFSSDFVHRGRYSKWRGYRTLLDSDHIKKKKWITEASLVKPTDRVHKGFPFSQPHDLEVCALCRCTTILTVYSDSLFNQFRSIIRCFKSAREMKHLAGPAWAQDVHHLICDMWLPAAVIIFPPFLLLKTSLLAILDFKNLVSANMAYINWILSDNNSK